MSAPIRRVGYPARVRLRDHQPFVTDNGNRILDCQVGPIDRPSELDEAIRHRLVSPALACFLEWPIRSSFKPATTSKSVAA